jgi:alpha-methylacyl-CoA racemase
MQPAPAPRFSRTASVVQGAPVKPGADTDTALAQWGFDSAEIAQLKSGGAIA